MTTPAHKWIVHVDRTIESDMVTAIQRLATQYGVPVSYSAREPDATLLLQIHTTGYGGTAISLQRMATFTVLLTLVLDGGSVDAICNQLADDAVALLVEIGSGSAA